MSITYRFSPSLSRSHSSNTFEISTLFVCDRKNAEIVNFFVRRVFISFRRLVGSRKIVFYSLYCEFIVMAKMQMCLFRKEYLAPMKSYVKRDEERRFYEVLDKIAFCQFAGALKGIPKLGWNSHEYLHQCSHSVSIFCLQIENLSPLVANKFPFNKFLFQLSNYLSIYLITNSNQNPLIGATTYHKRADDFYRE